MGTYQYLLTTKSRKIKTTTGDKIEVFLLKFDGKVSIWRNTPPHELATLARMENAWARRGTPSYIVHEGYADLKDGETQPVYTDISETFSPSFHEAAFDKLRIAGMIRMVGGKPIFEPWVSYEIKMNFTGDTKEHEMRERLCELASGDFSIVRNLTRNSIMVCAPCVSTFTMIKVSGIEGDVVIGPRTSFIH
jgi:hypothetical protein